MDPDIYGQNALSVDQYGHFEKNMGKSPLFQEKTWAYSLGHISVM